MGPKKKTSTCWTHRYVCNRLLLWRRCNVNGAGEKGQKHCWKILQRCSIKDIEQHTIRKGTCSWVSNVSDIYMIMAGEGNHKSEQGFTTPSIFTRLCHLWLLLLFRNWKPSSLDGSIGQDRLGAAVYKCLRSIPKSAYRDAFGSGFYRL